MKAIVFDLDGTLVDSAPDLHAAANTLLSENNCSPIPLETTRSFIGHGIPNLVGKVIQARGLDSGSADRMVARFTELYSAAPAVYSKEYDGVSPLLNELVAREFALGVCTNKDEAITRKMLDELNLSNFFNVIVGGDTLAERKPDPAPLLHAFDELSATSRLFVGDSEVDAQTSSAAKIPFALFTGGYRKRAVLEIEHTFSFDAFEVFIDQAGSALLSHKSAS